MCYSWYNFSFKKNIQGNMFLTKSIYTEVNVSIQSLLGKLDGLWNHLRIFNEYEMFQLYQFLFSRLSQTRWNMFTRRQMHAFKHTANKPTVGIGSFESEWQHLFQEMCDWKMVPSDTH